MTAALAYRPEDVAPAPEPQVAPVAAPAGRDRVLDVFKALLVVGMVLAHCIQLLGPTVLPAGLQAASDYVNLVTFSGFMFAFGAGCAASGTGRPKPLVERLTPLATLLFAFYLSAAAWRLLVTPGRLSWAGAVDILSFRDINGYCEFLASFFVLAISTTFFRRPLLRLWSSPKAVAGAVVLALLSTAINEKLVTNNLLGLVVGSRQFAAFPILNYGLWFVLGGAWVVAGRRIGPRLWALAAACTGAFMLATLLDGLPRRFSPSVLWLIGPALAFAVYLTAARALAAVPGVNGFAARIGRGVLLQLLASNLAIFGLQAAYGRFLDGWPATLALATALVLAIEGLREIAKR